MIFVIKIHIQTLLLVNSNFCNKIINHIKSKKLKTMAETNPLDLLREELDNDDVKHLILP